MKIKTLKITGIEQLIYAVCGENGDSYKTFIENENTDNVAQHEFVAGENDLRQLAENIIRAKTSGEICPPYRSFVHVYFELDDVPLDFNRIMRNNGTIRVGDVYMASYADLIEIKYMRIDNACFSTLGDWLQFNEWIKSLPYQELLTA